MLSFEPPCYVLELWQKPKTYRRLEILKYQFVIAGWTNSMLDGVGCHAHAGHPRQRVGVGMIRVAAGIDMPT